jgi:GH15 family glucan-1,4-alpha-glucosidase
VPDRYTAIEDHAVIGDLHTVAPVAKDGTVDWCCLPRFDSPAAFASLLDADRGGSFPADGRPLGAAAPAEARPRMAGGTVAG